mmetsp:Transcript_53234/g.158699  ORF Transcript_53234/g.158699 Transcript_53234/m.158699 type:complete len:221 (-) Transcript_53234:57-719(-)
MPRRPRLSRKDGTLTNFGTRRSRASSNRSRAASSPRRWTSSPRSSSASSRSGASRPWSSSQSATGSCGRRRRVAGGRPRSGSVNARTRCSARSWVCTRAPWTPTWRRCSPTLWSRLRSPAPSQRPDSRPTRSTGSWTRWRQQPRSQRLWCASSCTPSTCRTCSARSSSDALPWRTNGFPRQQKAHSTRPTSAWRTAQWISDVVQGAVLRASFEMHSILPF